MCITMKIEGAITMQTFLELRLDRNLTKKAVSQATGISTYKLTQIESGNYEHLYALDFVLLAKFYSVKPSQIKTAYTQEQEEGAETEHKGSTSEEVLKQFNSTVNYLTIQTA